jgi:O-methyltransferase involved in polyketide biosynthesis
MTTPLASNFDKISPTALLTAYVRQFSNIPYTKEVAELSQAIDTIKQYQSEGQEQEQAIVVAALIEARYKAIDQVIGLFGGKQILELASGLLPRGMIWSQNPDITFIESDLPGMIHRKQQLVQQLLDVRPNLHFSAIDATQRPNPLPLPIAYFHPEKPVTIACEGLLMYLTFPEKQQVFANVREILQIYGGVWITSDFTTKEGAGQLRQSEPGLRQVNQNISSFTGRSFTETAFNNLEDAKQFALEQGFRVEEEFSMLEVLDQLHSVSVLGIDLESAKPLLATTPIFALTLA